MNKIAVVTGAGSGIGRETVVAFARTGFAVALAGRNTETLNETARLASGEANMLIVPTDVSDEKSVVALFAKIKEAFGRVDILFNNAGVNVPTAPLDQVRLADWNRAIAVNLTGAFLCAREAFRLMKEQRPRGGRIINNASLAAQTPRPEHAAYATSKHGVSGLTKSLSIEGRAFDIGCGQIDIGNARTSMSAPNEAGALQPDGSILSEPRIDVRNIVDAVLYMANLPLDANVPSITVMATRMPFAGRG